MPLNKSKTKAAFKSNIAELISSGRDPKQAAAIAWAVKRGRKKKR